MRAKVVQIESASQFVDKKRRITLKFMEADQIFSQVRFPEDKIVGFDSTVALDDVLEVEMFHVRPDQAHA